MRYRPIRTGTPSPTAEFALADPKSQPDDKVRALADDITKGITDRRAQAVAIFDLVATNIRYYEVILNQGGWMPHPAGDILRIATATARITRP